MLRKGAAMTEPQPRRDIPVAVLVDGVEVRGTITALYPNDLTVEITHPVAGFRAGLHIPWFAAHARAVASGAGGLTPYGREQAEWLLRRCYAYSRGEHEGWPVDALGPDGWRRMADYGG
jgi:hypothetical protein